MNNKEYKGKFIAFDPMSNYGYYDGKILGSERVDKKRPFLLFDFAVMDILGIGKFKNKYEAIIVEMTHFKYISSQKILFGQRAILSKYAEFLQIPLIEYAPAAIKKSFTGDGRADKQDMIKECERRGIKVKNDHEADAVALWHHHIEQIKEK